MCTHASAYVAHNRVHPCVFLENGGPHYRVWMKYGSHLALRPPTPTPRCFPWAIWSDEGGGVWAGLRGEVYTGRVWDRLHNLPGTLLSNYSSTEWGVRVGMRGPLGHLHVKCIVALKSLLGYRLKGAPLLLVVSVSLVGVGSFGECGCFCPNYILPVLVVVGSNRQFCSKYCNLR